MVLDEKHSLKKEARAPGSSAKININGHGVQIGAGLTHDGKNLSFPYYANILDSLLLQITVQYFNKKLVLW